MSKRLEGKKALVTGAGKQTGIGFAIAKKLAMEGADVIVADLVRQLDEKFEGYVRTSDADLMQETVAALKETGVEAYGVPLDVTDPESVKAMAAEVADKFGKIDILINNAGGSPGVSTLVAMEESSWLYNFDLNLHGPWRVTRALYETLNDGAGIVNVSSRAGKVPAAFQGAYCTAKAGLIMMTRIMALEFSPRKIRANSVCPGQIDTELGQWGWKMKAGAEGLTYEQYREVLASRLPAKRLGKPQDVADVAVYLVTDEASFITGQAINVTGGQLMEL